MPAVDTGGAKTGGPRIRVKKKPAPKVTRPTPDQADRNTKPRTAPPAVKVRAYAHPYRKEPQKVITKAVADEDTAKAKRAETKAVVHTIHVTPVPSPDATDSKRSPAQQAHDRAFTQQSGQQAHTRAIVKGRQTRVRAAVTGKGGKVIDASKQFEANRARARKERAARLAPVIDVLEEVTRPLHAVAAAAKENVHAIKTEGLKPLPLYLQASPKKTIAAAAKGAQNKDKSTFSDVLTEAGWKPKSTAGKLAKGATALTLDVGLDPTTYITGGTGSVAKSAAQKEAAKAAKQAAASGLSKKATKVAVSKAASKAYQANVHKGAGVTIKFAGHEAPGVRRATAVAGRGGGKAVRKVVPERARDAVRDAASEVSPHVRLPGVSKVTHEKARAAARKERATRTRGERAATNLAHGIKKQIGAKNYARVVDAIEARNIASLPAHLQPHAETVRQHLKEIRKTQKAAHVRVPERKGYVPRKLTPETIKAEQKQAARVGGRGSTSPGSSKARKEQRTMAELRAQEPGRYREDLHALVAERLAEGHASAARANLAQDLAKLGRPVVRGSRPVMSDREALYKLKDGALTEISPASKGFLKKPPKNHPLKAQYVVLNSKLVERTLGTTGAPSGSAIVHGYDKVQGGFKRLALATPGYHLRNFAGDTAQAYVHQPGYKLPGNMVRAGRVLKAVGREEKAQRALGTARAGTGTLKTKHYGHVTYEHAAQKLIEAGAARSGYTARELRELATSGSKKLRTPKTPAGVRRAFLNREDLPRLATAIHAVRQGATWEEAAQKVANVHFDYAELSPFERNIARRILPFYTFTSRNVPLQAKRIVTNPGKYATYQKIREEATNLVHPDEQDPKTRDLYEQLERAGVKLQGGWEKYLTEYEQRNAGVPVSWKGQKFTVSAGLPLSDLNELPGASGGAQATEYLNKAASMVSPLFKDPVEFGFNYSFFFRDQVERDNSPLVNAPGPVGAWPDWAKRKFGVVKAKDKRSGEMVWKWPGRADYVAHAVPGLVSAAVKMATPGHDRQGKSTGGKLLSLAGVKSVPIDATTNAVNLAYARGQEIQKQLNKLRDQGYGKDNPTPEWRRLSDQLKIVNQIAYRGKTQRGDAVLPKQGGPPKGSSGPRIKLGGGSTGRVKLGGSSGGRVNLGG